MEKLHILIAYNGKIPVRKYGGTGRDIWYLGKELVRMGHTVTYLVGAGSRCDFARVLPFNSSQPLSAQIPGEVDLVHSHQLVSEPLPKPYMVTLHGNTRNRGELDRNTTFISRNHAARFGSEVFVYNGLGLEEYGTPDLDRERNYLHFLGKAAWKKKNLDGSIKVARRAGIPLRVLGGRRLILKMGFRLNLDRHVRFEGMVGGARKNRLINGSMGLVFPVRWHEPMGLSVVESLYFGCPVFGTPYGALPEIVTPEFGYLSNRVSELAAAVAEAPSYDRRKCHEYVCDNFASIHMTRNFLPLYEKVLNGEPLNPKPPRFIHTAEPVLLPFYDD